MSSVNVVSVPCSRVIVDECVGKDSTLIQRFRQILPPEVSPEFVWIRQAHPAIPDIALRGLLGPDTILLTHDRVLHNQVCDLGLRSYTLDEHGNLRRKKLGGIQTPKPLQVSCELKSNYHHPPNPVGSALKHGMSERDFKRYYTRRRRIRSYFGSEDMIASVALTIGGRMTARGLLSGYFLKLAGNSGVKGLQASEGYCLSGPPQTNHSVSVFHAVREVYLLQLENIRAELYIIPPSSFALCEDLLKPSNIPQTTPENESLCRMLKGLRAVQLFPCEKGPFFERMEAKLRQLSSFRTNEIVNADFAGSIQAVNALQMPGAPSAATDAAT